MDTCEYKHKGDGQNADELLRLYRAMVRDMKEIEELLGTAVTPLHDCARANLAHPVGTDLDKAVKKAEKAWVAACNSLSRSGNL